MHFLEGLEFIFPADVRSPGPEIDLYRNGRREASVPKWIPNLGR